MSLRPKKSPLFVFAHDAGGAEILAAYVRANAQTRRFHVYAAEPALAIFRREGVTVKKLMHANLKKIVAACRGKSALLGTGHPKSLERAVLRELKRRGIQTASYIDSWTNYRERFGYPRAGWKKNLPDEIWAGDLPALTMAKRYFAHMCTRLVPNQYFAAITSRYRSRARTAHRPRGILYMSAAARLSEKLLSDFLAECSRLKIKSLIRVRMHPENQRARYERIIRRIRDVRTELSSEKDIVNDLLRAGVVVGPETNALVAALLTGLKTIRIVPKGKKHFLPFRKIIRVSDARSAARRIDS